MDAYTFIERLIGHLAWPIFAAFVLILFRMEIAKLVDRLSKLKAMGVESEFASELKEAERVINKAHMPIVTNSSAPLAYEKDALSELLASKYPEVLILEAWRKLEQAYFNKNSRQIEDQEFLETEKEILPVYEELRKLKNSAILAAPGTISPQQAEEYVRFATQLMSIVEKLYTLHS